MGALTGTTVLEIGGSQTLYAGKLLADQGADVLLVEPLEGHESRRIPPFAPDASGDVTSISFAYFNGNKRSAALPLMEPPGLGAFPRLIDGADVILAGGRPSDITRLGITPTSLPERTVVTTITPFGWTGPYAEWLADDLTLSALGGLLNMGGYHDGRPLKVPGLQSYVAAGIFGAIGTVAALIEKETTGAGQHVDVSVHESVTMALENAAQFYDFEGTVRRRHGGSQVQAARGAYRCRDGYVYLMAGVRAEAKFWRKLLQWLDEESVPGRGVLSGEKWLQRDYVESEEAKELFHEVFSAFCAEKTQTELYTGARSRAIPLAPINDLTAVLDSEQLAAREFLRRVPREDWPHGPVTAPGAPYRMSATPWDGSYSPPALEVASTGPTERDGDRRPQVVDGMEEVRP